MSINNEKVCTVKNNKKVRKATVLVFVADSDCVPPPGPAFSEDEVKKEAF